MQIAFEPVNPANQDDGQHDGVANVLKGSTAPEVMTQAHVLSRGSSETRDSGIVGHPEHRQLADVEVFVHARGFDPFQSVALRLTIGKPDGTIAVVDIPLYGHVDAFGEATVTIVIDRDLLNHDFTDVCDGCTMQQEVSGCPETTSICDGDDFTVSVSSKECAYLCKVYLSH